MRNKNRFDKEAFERFCRTLTSLSSPEEIREFLTEVLTDNERLDISLRWHLMELLKTGLTQRKIAEQLKISLCKITRGSKILKSPGSVTARKLREQDAVR